METPRQPTHVAQQNASLPHSPWHSPVPYLFGGLAAMLGLIAFALLVLACSYSKLSGYLEGNGELDLEAGEGKNDGEIKKPPQPVEEKILVIMAGEMRPTFLAMPMPSRSSSFGVESDKTCCCSSEKNEKLEEEEEVKLQSGSGGDQVKHCLIIQYVLVQHYSHEKCQQFFKAI
ncbi:protein GLUTAMINE DUMPER 2-like isoform X2 [Mangifera indica]|uniref:protein GLUTAMINE DUMPER 2-like isoform X2 n=1 Tax=Mangifera indica TaxID=29780 RepID=UPI001CFB1430|nr:protein GLUTAMINE DUMPER 2-like isoform X2 [Mangifera indica]